MTDPTTPEELAREIIDGSWVRAEYPKAVARATDLIAEAFERWAGETADTEENGYPLTEARLGRDKWKARYHAEMESTEARVTHWKLAACRLAKWRNLTLDRLDDAKRLARPGGWVIYADLKAAIDEQTARADTAEKRIAELEAELAHSILDATAQLVGAKADALARADAAEAEAKDAKAAREAYKRGNTILIRERDAAEDHARELADHLKASHDGFIAHLELEHPEWLTRHNPDRCSTCALLKEDHNV